MTLFPLDPISFRCAAPDSKKNRAQIVRVPIRRNGVPLFDRYGKPMVRSSILPSYTSRKQQEAIRAHLEHELGDRCYFDDHTVGVKLVHHARSDLIEVSVEDLGPRRRPFSGRKRDLQNLLEVVLDAMQGPVYRNDNQVARIEMERDLG